MSALKYWIWLSALEGVSVRTKAAVIRRFGDAESAFFSPAGAMAAAEGISPAEAAVLEERSLGRVDEILGDCERQGLSIVTMQDALYPKRLKAIWAPPVVLYVKGRLPHIDDEAAIAVVGTRSASAYGIKMSRQIAGEIVRCGGIVISGLTNGIDAAAAYGALSAEGVCVGVLGTAHEQQESELSYDVCQRGGPGEERHAALHGRGARAGKRGLRSPGQRGRRRLPRHERSSQGRRRTRDLRMGRDAGIRSAFSG